MQDINIHVRHLTPADYADVKEAMDKAYLEIGGTWTKTEYLKLLDVFPQGQIGVEVNGHIRAAALSLIIDYAAFGDHHTYQQVVGLGKFKNHTEKGDVLYGIDLFVHPDHQGLRLGRRLYDARKEMCESFNLRAIVAGGRIPGYAAVADQLSPKEYIDAVQHKEQYDPILTFQLNNGFHVKAILRQYLDIDSESKQFATLIEWNNIYYEPTKRLVGARKQVVRIGIVQWQMRRVKGLPEWLEQVEFFVDAVSSYKADFLVFPELFSAPLMAPYNNMPESEAIRQLAKFSEEIVDAVERMAVSYNVNIICGSLPVYREDELHNVAYLCRRDGSRDEQHKLHITPAEARAWGMVGGKKVKTFDTDAGRIGILICYDVEFPELTRLMADEGMDILFVPFMTDTQNGFMRVRYCAQARAIENECYVAMAGCVGNLPRVHNMDIQYAQSAVLSPSDFAFPTNAIVSEATPNTEMMLIADVDLDLIKELHEAGSVMNLKDRRKDIYKLEWVEH